MPTWEEQLRQVSAPRRPCLIAVRGLGGLQMVRDGDELVWDKSRSDTCCRKSILLHKFLGNGLDYLVQREHFGSLRSHLRFRLLQ